MNDRETFRLTYSAEQQEEIKQIRSKYVPQEPDKMEQLRALDARAGKKASRVSIAVGVIGTLIMGFGMSATMSDIGSIFGAFSQLIGIALGVIGIGILACAYPLYSRTLRRERKKLAPEILRLSDELLK